MVPVRRTGAYRRKKSWSFSIVHNARNLLPLIDRTY